MFVCRIQVCSPFQGEERYFLSEAHQGLDFTIHKAINKALVYMTAFSVC